MQLQGFAASTTVEVQVLGVEATQPEAVRAVRLVVIDVCMIYTRARYFSKFGTKVSKL